MDFSMRQGLSESFNLVRTMQLARYGAQQPWRQRASLRGSGTMLSERILESLAGDTSINMAMKFSTLDLVGFWLSTSGVTQVLGEDLECLRTRRAVCTVAPKPWNPGTSRHVTFLVIYTEPWTTSINRTEYWKSHLATEKKYSTIKISMICSTVRSSYTAEIGSHLEGSVCSTHKCDS